MIEITNDGPQPVANVIGRFFPVAPEAEACEALDNEWVCELGPLASGASVTLSFSGDTTGRVDTQGSFPFDPDLTNNLIREADVEPDEAPPGSGCSTTSSGSPGGLAFCVLGLVVWRRRQSRPA
ncbi:MAG: MYXO-CTERM sorting domain-containing protein [Myxococcota bacterium]